MLPCCGLQIRKQIGRIFFDDGLQIRRNALRFSCLLAPCGFRIFILIRFSLLYFFLRDALAVDGAPGEDDVGEDERDEERNYRHGAERELAAATVGEGERALKVDVRRIVGGIVPAGYQQQNQHGEYGSDARKPDSLSILHASR